MSIDQQRRGFTLIEMIAVILVLVILSAVAIPRFVDYSDRAVVGRVSADLKRLKRAVVQYRIDQGAFPPDEAAGLLMPTYLSQDFNNTPSALGVGLYNWNYFGGTIGDWCIYMIGTMPPAQITTRMQRIDALIDDGNLSTGTVVFEPGSWGGTLRIFCYGP